MVSQKHGDPICKPSFGIAAYLVAPPLGAFSVPGYAGTVSSRVAESQKRVGCKKKKSMIMDCTAWPCYTITTPEYAE
jgi:hypothetical protein